MSKVIVDDELRAKLKGLEEHVELRDSSGKMLAHILPREQFEKMLFEIANAQTSDTRMRQFAEQARQGDGRSLVEIWRSLPVE